jgi:hypothetical protein
MSGPIWPVSDAAKETEHSCQTSRSRARQCAGRFGDDVARLDGQVLANEAYNLKGRGSCLVADGLLWLVWSFRPHSKEVTMLKWIRPVLCASILASNPFPAQGRGNLGSMLSPATIVNPAISFGPGYALPSAYWAYPNFVQAPEFPTAGDELLILGKVAAFQAPFEDLDPADPTLEFTYRMRNLTVDSWGIWDDFQRNEGGIFVDYRAGILEIYRDTSPDADFADAGTFADGEMILSATVDQLWLILYSSVTPPQSGNLVFTGGTLFDRVSDEGKGFTATDAGNFSMDPDAIPDDLEALGYNALSQTTISINPGVPVSPTTWGRIKALYAVPTMN